MGIQIALPKILDGQGNLSTNKARPTRKKNAPPKERSPAISRSSSTITPRNLAGTSDSWSRVDYRAVVQHVYLESQLEDQQQELGTGIMEPRNHNKRTIEEVPARIRPALRVLLEAVYYAEQTSGDCWEFAVELDQLTALGLTSNDFRWLVRKGLVEHQREVTLEGDDGRAFRPTGDLTFSEATCFILTDAGISVACGSCPAATAGVSPSSPLSVEENVRVTILRNFSKNEKGPRGEPSVPTWDSERRELRINEITVKRFKWTAANPEAILAAFEEEGWPDRIDDPLPPKPEQDSKRRLSDTIKCLNRKQINQLIHFRGDATGEGVTWELVEQDGSNEKSRQ